MVHYVNQLQSCEVRCCAFAGFYSPPGNIRGRYAQNVGRRIPDAPAAPIANPGGESGAAEEVSSEEAATG